jgi:hypothetical protein
MSRKSLAIGMFFVGVLACASSAGAAKPWERGALQIGPDKRTIVHADGTPFFWLDDPAKRYDPPAKH